jgi:hypothetical protein
MPTEETVCSLADYSNQAVELTLSSKQLKDGEFTKFYLVFQQHFVSHNSQQLSVSFRHVLYSANEMQLQYLRVLRSC